MKNILMMFWIVFSSIAVYGEIAVSYCVNYPKFIGFIDSAHAICAKSGRIKENILYSKAYETIEKTYRSELISNKVQPLYEKSGAILKNIPNYNDLLYQRMEGDSTDRLALIKTITLLDSANALLSEYWRCLHYVENQLNSSCDTTLFQTISLSPVYEQYGSGSHNDIEGLYSRNNEMLFACLASYYFATWGENRRETLARMKEMIKIKLANNQINEKTLKTITDYDTKMRAVIKDGTDQGYYLGLDE